MIEFRRANSVDVTNARALILEVTSEIYGHVIRDVSLTVTSEQEVVGSLLAFDKDKLVGVGATDKNRIDDLWILPEWRGEGIGGKLLLMMEQSIHADGYREAVLRVVAQNKAALKFYERYGWKSVRTYAHEKLGIEMVDYTKML